MPDKSSSGRQTVWQDGSPEETNFRMKMLTGSFFLRAAVSFLALLAVLVACGRKTDPLTPDSPRPAVVSDLRVAVRDNVAYLTWSVPTKNIEGRPLPVGDVKGFSVYRAEAERTRRRLRWKERAEIGMANPAPATVRNGVMSWSDAGLVYGRVYAYRVRSYSVRGGTSGYSSEVLAAPLLSLAFPKNVAAMAEDGGVVLSWDAVTTRSDGSVYEGFVGYNVYRGTAPGAEVEKPINTEPVRTTSYRDGSVLNGTKYFYRVRSIDSPVAPWKESLDSTEVSATPRDMTPPAVPTGLTVVPGIGRVFLTWKENREKDLAGYLVYRASRKGGEYERLTERPILRSTYSDETVRQGMSYYYRITAIDKSGNESAPSKEYHAYTEKIR